MTACGRFYDIMQRYRLAHGRQSLPFTVMRKIFKALFLQLLSRAFTPEKLRLCDRLPVNHNRVVLVSSANGTKWTIGAEGPL